MMRKKRSYKCPDASEKMFIISSPSSSVVFDPPNVLQLKKYSHPDA
jgi:hypothetical protein